MTAKTKTTAAPLVLIHAFPLSSVMWQSTIEAHSNERPVLAIDLPGFGKEPPASTPCTMESYARFVKNRMDSFGLREPAVVAGVSMGGYILFRFLELFPESVRGVVLASTRSAPDSAEGRERRFKTIELVETQGLTPFAGKMIPTLLGKSSQKENLELVDSVRGWIEAGSTTGVTAALRGMADRPDSTPLLERIFKPALVVSGEEDAIIPSSEMKEMAARIKGAQFEIVSKAGHLVNLEKPPEFDAHLAAFLSSVDRLS